MIKQATIFAALALLLSVTTKGAQPPVSHSTDAIINLPLSDTWHLFSTANGLTDMGYQDVTMQLKLDEHIHAARKAEKSVETIDATLISFDPPNMLSWRWSGDNACWSVLYFNAMGKEMTQIRWVDMCNDDQTPMLERASQAHRDLFNKLIRRYAPECHVCKEEREAAASKGK